MHGRLTPVRALQAEELAAWGELGRRAVEANPMFEPDFLLAAAHHLPDGAGIELVTASEGAEMLGAFPVRRLARHHRLRLPMLTTKVRRMTYLGTPLLAPERRTEAARSLLATLVEARSRHRCRFLLVEWLGTDGPAAAALRQAVTDLGLTLFEHQAFLQPALGRRPDGDYASLQGKRHRKDYERRARRLSEQVGAELEVVDRAGDPAAIDDYIALEAAGYKLDAGVAMAGWPGEPAYFRELCRRFAEQDRLHVLQLQAGGRTVAMQISVEAGDTVFLLKVGHDEAFAPFDPGVQLHLRAMAHVHHHTGARAIRVCTFGGNELLLRLYPERRPTATWMIGLGGGLSHTLVRSLPRAQALARRRGGRRGPPASGRSEHGGPRPAVTR